MTERKRPMGVTVPVTSQRLGQMDNPHGRIENLGRVRVVVG